MKDNSETLNMILQKEKEGLIVFEAFDGLMQGNIDEFIKQPTEGILYDLNRDKATCLTFIKGGAVGWINNYATALVISKLKEKLEKYENQ